jgi:hypothetical protein
MGNTWTNSHYNDDRAVGTDSSVTDALPCPAPLREVHKQPCYQPLNQDGKYIEI